MTEQLYIYRWAKNVKPGLKGRLCRVLIWGTRKRRTWTDSLGRVAHWRGGNTRMVEFTDNGQKEIISGNALRKVEK